MLRIILMAIRSMFNLPSWTIQIKRYTNVDNYDIPTRYQFVRKLIRTIIKRGRVEVELHGIENLPKNSGYVLYPNHQGLFDALAIIKSHDAPITAISKIENQNLFFVKDIFKLLSAKFIVREDVRGSMKILVEVTKEVENGRNYMIFPEGTRSKRGNEIGDFKAGSFKVSMNSKTPIVPVAILDSFKVFDINSIKKTKVQIHYLKPLYYDDYKDMKSVEIASYVANEIKKTMEANKIN